ncbi:MAG: ABC transporter substrate-binding protein [Sneathiellaceae bacterium]
MLNRAATRAALTTATVAGAVMAGALALAVAPQAQAADKAEASLILNWIAGGDHAPYYYAKQEGWYDKAGLDLTIEQGKGSQLATQRVGIGANQLGLADMGVVLTAIGAGADIVAIMNVYANTPQGFYWLKSSGITGPKDFPGKKIGNPPSDAARAMFPVFAKAVGIDPDSVDWINVQPNAKLSALKAGSIDVTTSFYNIHHIFQGQLGDDMGFVSWKDVGVNPYGNSLIANGAFLKEHPDAVKTFVEVSQKAFAYCVENGAACVEALVSANTGLKQENELQNWGLVTELMSNEHSQNVGLGHFEDSRMADDYAMVEKYFEIKQPYDVKNAYTNEFIDTSVKMPKM